MFFLKLYIPESSIIDIILSYLLDFILDISQKLKE